MKPRCDSINISTGKRCKQNGWYGLYGMNVKLCQAHKQAAIKRLKSLGFWKDTRGTI